MPISNPSEQLIHDLVRERAKEYQETVRRFKARQAQNQKAAEADTKRRVEYLRNAGIKVDQLAQHDNEDARLLKARLDETRPALITRPSLSVQDARHRAHLTARLLNLGQIVLPDAGFYYPEDTNQEVPPSDPSKITIKDVEQGGASWPWAEASDPPEPPVDVVFQFVPPDNANYALSVYFAFHGFYYVNKGDSWFSSAGVSLDVSLNVFQFADRGWKSFPKLIDYNAQRTNDHFFDSYDQNLSFSDTQALRQGEAVVVTARIAVNADASRPGSYAEINFKDGDANYIQPIYLWVTNLTGFGQ